MGGSWRLNYSSVEYATDIRTAEPEPGDKLDVVGDSVVDPCNMGENFSVTQTALLRLLEDGSTRWENSAECGAEAFCPSHHCRQAISRVAGQSSRARLATGGSGTSERALRHGVAPTASPCTDDQALRNPVAPS